MLACCKFLGSSASLLLSSVAFYRHDCPSITSAMTMRVLCCKPSKNRKNNNMEDLQPWCGAVWSKRAALWCVVVRAWWAVLWCSVAMAMVRCGAVVRARCAVAMERGSDHDYDTDVVIGFDDGAWRGRSCGADVVIGCGDGVDVAAMRTSMSSVA